MHICIIFNECQSHNNKKTFPSFKTVMHRFLRCVVPPVQWAVNRTLSEAPHIRIGDVIIYCGGFGISWALTKCN